jgi:hypothetical protein
MNEAEGEICNSQPLVKRKWRANSIPSPQYLKVVFRYEPETGKLYRREDRPASHFKGKKGYALFLRDFAGQEAGAKKFHSKNGDPLHIYVRVDREHYMAHRIIWTMVYGYIPEDHMVDHKDGNPFNNRLNNLRLGKSPHNQWNSKSEGYRKKSALPKGVCAGNGRFRAKAQHLNKLHHIGYFDTPEAAAKAYQDFVRSLRAEFIRRD